MSHLYGRPTKLEEGVQLNYNLFAKELGAASFALGKLQSSQESLKNPALLVAPLTAKEAEVSSRIEGTVSTVTEVFQFEAGVRSAKENDTRQVANYRRAMQWALSELRAGKEINAALIRSTHAILLNKVRHSGPLGNFRNEPVWIGRSENDPIEKALYVPPEALLVPEYMDDLFRYLKNGVEQPLVKAAVAHYQFEAVHPFGDGNGRVGRILIPMIICAAGQLSNPILYLSGYFEDHKDEYIAALRKTDQTKDLSEWVRFFLGSVATQLGDTQKLIEKIKVLHKTVHQKFAKSKSPYASRLIDFLFESPGFTVPQAQRSLGADRLTIVNLLKEFAKLGIVKEAVGIRIGHAKLYSFPPLLELL